MSGWVPEATIVRIFAKKSPQSVACTDWISTGMSGWVSMKASAIA